jgi:hypothetical protein
VNAPEQPSPASLAKAPGRGGRRPGAGRPRNPVSAGRELERARDRGRKAIERAIKRLAAYLEDPDTKVDTFFLQAVAQLADRLGLPRSTQHMTEARVENRSLVVNGTIDQVREAIQDAARTIAADPAPGLVFPVEPEPLEGDIRGLVVPVDGGGRQQSGSPTKPKGVPLSPPSDGPRGDGTPGEPEIKPGPQDEPERQAQHMEQRRRAGLDRY